MGPAAILIALVLLPFLEGVKRPIEYDINRLLPTRVFEPMQAVEQMRRGNITPDDYHTIMSMHGYTNETADLYLQLQHPQLDSALLIDAFRRQIIDQQTFESRMVQLGYTPSETDTLLKQAAFYPSPGDLIEWEAKGVQRPDIVETFNLDAGIDAVTKEPFYRAGITDEQIRNFWIAHWQPPDYTNIRRFVHWNQISPDQIDQWYNEARIPPFWREKYKNIVYDPPTRIDLRRMWDFGVISDTDMQEDYQKLGYSPEDAAKLVTFGKMISRAPEIRRLYSNGWITEAQVLQMLLDVGVQQDVATRYQQTIVKADKPARTAAHRNLTVAMITNGYNMGFLSHDQTKTLLVQLGYEPAEAEFVIAVEEKQTKSAKSTIQHATLVIQALNAAGFAATTIPQEVVDADNAYLAAQEAYQQAIDNGAEQSVISGLSDAMQQAQRIVTRTLQNLGLSHLAP